MYAVIRTGGKQYKVKAGDLIKVEKLNQSEGDEFNMPDVLMVSGKKSHLGEPLVSNATVQVQVIKSAKAKKVLVFKKKRRKGYRKMQGHRQEYTELFVKSITCPDGESMTAEFKKAAKVEKEKPTATKKAAKKKTAKKKTATKKKATKKATKKKATKKKATKKKTTKKA